MQEAYHLTLSTQTSCRLPAESRPAPLPIGCHPECKCQISKRYRLDTGQEQESRDASKRRRIFQSTTTLHPVHPQDQILTQSGNVAPSSSVKTNIKSYSRVLQEHVSLEDSQWEYDLEDLPPAAEANAGGLVKAIALTTKDEQHRLNIALNPLSPSRATSSHPLDRFISISFKNFRSLHGSASHVVWSQPTTPRECSDYVVKLLRAGVRLNGTHYRFFGHSQSQLKSRTCYLFAASKEVISGMVEGLGDFSKMKIVSKKAKRLGLLFSTAEVAMDVDPSRCEDIEDIETKDYIFTDGCGLIAPRLAQELARRTGIVFRNTRYTPSVFQIRYRGYKGVVTLDPNMKDGKTLLKLRRSMRKPPDVKDFSFSVVDYSKPYDFGNLNDEVILLLHSLGISCGTLLRKQEAHINFLASATADPRAAFRFLTYINQYELAEKVLLESLEPHKARVASLVNQEYAKMIKEKNGEQRCRIAIPKSRLLFGVCDAEGVLKAGECQVRITMDGDGLPVTLVGTEVIVTRNPCLHPGDLQKFKVVQRDELAHLVDCIVFSTSIEGKRPAADLMSGGDLDGDTFFVSWDEDIIPSTVSEAAEYPGGREPVSFKPVTDDDRLVYFAKYTNASLGKVKNLYLDWARVGDPMSQECQELNRLFSMCVDAKRIKIPKRLEEPPEPKPGDAPFVLDVLHEEAKKLILKHQTQMRSDSTSLEGYTFDALELLLCRQDVAMSEFELIQLTHKWCLKNNACLKDFAHYFDFGLLSSEQKAWTLAHLPATEEYSKLAYNGLCQSDLLEETELHQFKLHYPGLHWKRFYTSSRDRLATFLDSASKSLELFQRKLIVLRVDERLTIAIYIPEKVEKSRDCKIDNKARLFAFPHSRGENTISRLSLPTKMNYHVYCDNNGFQLFQGTRANTWVFIGRSAANDAAYRNALTQRDRRKARHQTVEEGVNFDFRASIALDKFSRQLQTHIGRVNRNGVLGAEIYVISNRDVSSIRNLDVWLEYVDTQEIVPLFEQSAREYSRPSIKNVDWNEVPNEIVQIVQRQNFLALLTLDKVVAYTDLFSWLLQRGETDLLTRSYQYLLTGFGEGKATVQDPEMILGEMISFTRSCPFLSVVLTQMDWTKLDGKLQDVLATRTEEILSAMILSANGVGQLMLQPLQAVLARANMLSAGVFTRLMELIALTVRSPSLALDILLLGLEPEVARLMAESPSTTQHLVRSLSGIVLDHVEEASEEGQERPELLSLKRLDNSEDGWPQIQVDFRLDARGGTPEASAHVRLTAASPPSNTFTTRKWSMDALVTKSTQGSVEMLCYYPLPPYLEECSWRLEHCGPFVTSKTMMAATLDLAVHGEAVCGIADTLYSTSSIATLSTTEPALDYTPGNSLNEAQNAAIVSALESPLTCLWGPPGTGKTHTIVEMIRVLQERHEDSRFLVTAPTHNAVDNVMRRYLSEGGGWPAIRVSTEVRKVGEDLRKYTCDAMAGQEIYDSHQAMKKAKTMVKSARIVFTTCIAASLGLLRGQAFDIVIIDEASQQTEPASLVPLTKGCTKTILVGDHVQLRPTVGQLAATLDYDVSLFERLWKAKDNRSIPKVMLDTQYRMHKDICQFSSQAFYEGKLRTGAQERPIFASSFPWPADRRIVFIECSAPEDLGQKSKSNRGQAMLCQRVCELLSKEAPDAHKQECSPKPSIAVLTPYTRQADLLRHILSSYKQVEVCSIDGFQGREAEIVVFVTVRCNQKREIGFLKDLRRLNVAMTRAKSGVVVLGNKATLSMGPEAEESTRVWKQLVEGLCVVDVSLEKPRA